MLEIDRETLRAIQAHFHVVIRGRAGNLVDKHSLELPELSAPLNDKERKEWLPVPGMYGGFSYWFEGRGREVRLVVESWCRVVEGSGQRHQITAAGANRVDKGFV